MVLTVQSYADPLRNFARQDYTKIIPLYEAKALFTNIDAIVVASEVFSRDLEHLFAAGSGSEIIGDVCLRHVSDSLIYTNCTDEPIVERPEDDGPISDVYKQAGRVSEDVPGRAEEVPKLCCFHRSKLEKVRTPESS
jgi:hypothetical protein